MYNTSTSSHRSDHAVSRRRVSQGLAWSVPAIAGVAAVTVRTVTYRLPSGQTQTITRQGPFYIN